jgi:ATP-dependent DNA helicase PIF1
MMQNRSEIDLNPQFQRALALMEETKQHASVTGRAGTGKSTLLGYFR